MMYSHHDIKVFVKSLCNLTHFKVSLSVGLERRHCMHIGFKYVVGETMRTLRQNKAMKVHTHEHTVLSEIFVGLYFREFRKWVRIHKKILFVDFTLAWLPRL